ATMRRAPAVEPGARNVLEAGDFRMQLDERKLTIKSQEIRLTPKEYDLMTYLLRHAGKVLTHHMLLGAVWGGDYTEQTEYLRVFIGQLRKKIEPDPSKPRYILTEPWIGYRFSSE